MTKAAHKTKEAAELSSVGKRRRVPESPAFSRKPASKTPIACPQPSKPASKRDQLAALLVRDKGATIAQMKEATGWLPHTVRAALTNLKKLGYAIDSDKVDGLRTYRAVAPE
jgi:hypothetical protein